MHARPAERGIEGGAVKRGSWEADSGEARVKGKSGGHFPCPKKTTYISSRKRKTRKRDAKHERTQQSRERLRKCLGGPDSRDTYHDNLSAPHSTVFKTKVFSLSLSLCVARP